MNIDIPLAGWILSVITFVLGTILPIIYRKFSHEGVGIRQPYDMRAIIQKEDDVEAARVSFSTIIKIANAQRDSILLDEIKLSELAPI